MANSLTLVEYAKGMDVNDPARPFIQMFAESTDIYAALPFEGLTGPVFEGYRTAQLPSPTFRAINEASSNGGGKITPFQESSFVMDHNIDIDRAIIDRHGMNRRFQEERMLVAAAGRKWVDTFLKGDNTTQPREFNGLAKRSALFSRTISNSASSGGGALSLLKLDQAINAVNKPTHIIAPFDSKPLWIQAARTSSLTGFVIQTWDQVGGPKMTYAGLPILFGYEKDDNVPVLQFNEVGSGGGSAVTASLYVVSFGEGKLRGIQLKPMSWADKGLLEDGITYRTHLSWDVGLVDEHKYCFSRLTSWTNAAMVA
jgi:hypothetical protein